MLKLKSMSFQWASSGADRELGPGLQSRLPSPLSLHKKKIRPKKLMAKILFQPPAILALDTKFPKNGLIKIITAQLVTLLHLTGIL